MGLRSFPDPQSGSDLFAFEHGIDVASDNMILAQNMAKKGFTHARRLDNWEYEGGTLRRRKPFTAKSTLNFSEDAAWNSFSAPGAFKGGKVYVDRNGVTRLVTAHDNGTIYEWASAASESLLVSGLTQGQRVRFEDFNGACFAVNGADSGRRADGNTWRETGAPAAIASAPTAGASSAGNLEAGKYLVMVTAVRDHGNGVILESDHSPYLEIDLASDSQQVINWVASADTVSYYRVYRTTRNNGSPFYLDFEGNVFTHTLNTADADLPEQTAAPLGRNGTMPVASIIAKSGKRLAVVDEDGKICLSIIATNDSEMEYFPTDEAHRFKLPGGGSPTACFPIGNKDEDDNANDLFLAQPRACYILRNTDPYGTLERVSTQVGCRNPDAIAQWGRYLFFMSHRGLEFLGPSGSPVMISERANPYFFGGGPLNLPLLAGDEYLSLTATENRLLIAFRDDATKRGANKTLCLDLEIFNPFEPLNVHTTRFYGPWDGVGGFYIEGASSDLYLCDNQNYRLLQRGTGVYDSIAGVDTVIRDEWEVTGLVGALLTYRKRFRSVNIFQISDANTTISFKVDYGREQDLDRTLPMNAEPKDWDMPWDMGWGGSSKWKGCLGLPPRMVGSTLNISNRGGNASVDRVHIGLNFNFTQVKQRTVCAK